MNLNFFGDETRQGVFEKVRQELDSHGLKVVAADEARPWGGFFVIDESQAAALSTSNSIVAGTVCGL